jgi:hypothetical protein
MSVPPNYSGRGHRATGSQVIGIRSGSSGASPMTVVVDDPAFPMAWYLYAALGYVFGLGAIGYMAVLTSIRAYADRARWPPWLTNVVIGLHFALGLAAFTAGPPNLLHRLRLQGATSTEGGITFFITTVSVLSIGLLIASGWNRFRPSQTNRTR